MGPYIEDTGLGVFICVDVGTFIPGNCTGRPALWLGYMGGDPHHRESPGGGGLQHRLV